MADRSAIFVGKSCGTSREKAYCSPRLVNGMVAPTLRATKAVLVVGLASIAAVLAVPSASANTLPCGPLEEQDPSSYALCMEVMEYLSDCLHETDPVQCLTTQIGSLFVLLLMQPQHDVGVQTGGYGFIIKIWIPGMDITPSSTYFCLTNPLDAQGGCDP